MLLRDWLDAQDMSYVQAANRFGVSRITVYYWATGASRPNADACSRISEITAGAVSANDHQHAYQLAREYA